MNKENKFRDKENLKFSLLDYFTLICDTNGRDTFTGLIVRFNVRKTLTFKIVKKLFTNRSQDITFLK